VTSNEATSAIMRKETSQLSQFVISRQCDTVHYRKKCIINSLLSNQSYF